MSKPKLKPKAANGTDRRVFPRSTVIWSASTNGGSREVESVILNVSAGGAKLRVLSRLDDSPDVTLRIERAGDFPGTIVWRCDHYIGVRFDIAPEVAAGRLAQAMIVRRDPPLTTLLLGSA